MFIRPSFLQQPPPRIAVSAVLLTLLFASLPLVSSLPATVTGVFAVLWLLRVVLLQLNIKRLPMPLTAGLALGGGALVWSQLGMVFGREGGIAFLLLMAAVKTFESTKSRDWRVLLLGVVFLIGSTVLLNQSLIVGIWMITALFAVAACFALINGLPPKDAAKQGGWALLLTLPLAAVLFVSVPRLNEPLWRIPQNGGAQAKTGLSTSMEPGSISNLVQSNEWVANVVFSDGVKPAPHQLYWRAMIMGSFDGLRWEAVGTQFIDNAAAESGKAVRYQMVVRDQQGALPALDYPSGSLPKGLVRRLGNTVRAEFSREGLRRIDLAASLGDTLPQNLSQAEYGYYTALPENGNLQTRLLAESLAKQSSGSRDFIGRVLQHYRNRKFGYTLQPQPTPGRDGIDEFMFRTRQGFCEHYAQSFVVMMRSGGLPARVVTGYLGAEYNSDAGFWQIRAKDAHAWAEVWLPSEKAWLRVDPTAAVSSNRITSGIGQALPPAERSMVSDGQNTFSRWRDTGQFYWQQWVVNYDQSRQNSLFARLGLGGFNLKTMSAVLSAGLVLALLPLWKWWTASRRRERDPLREGFTAVKTALLGSSDDTAPAVSPGELLRMMRDNRIDDPALEQLLQQYEHWLYAAEPPAKRIQHRWYRAAAKAAKRYGNT